MAPLESDEYDSSAECFEARQMLRELPFSEPVDDVEEDEAPSESNAWATFGNKHGVFRLVGNGKVTNFNCGSPYRFKSCPTSEKHGCTLHGDFRNKAYLTLTYTRCHKADCPVCYKYGWVARAATAIENRIMFASKGGYDAKGVYHAPMGKPEHIVVSLPRELYHLSPAMMFRKAIAAVKARGIEGSVAIWHGLRYNVLRGWYVGHHFHFIGFLVDGYPCRSCETMHYRGTDLICDKVVCDGFARRTRDLNVRDGMIVKVLSERRSVWDTAWYQLEHCVIQVGKPRFQPYRWAGSLGCRKMAPVKVERKRSRCPICGSEEVAVFYRGSKKIVHEPWRIGYEKRVLVEVEEGGEPVMEIAEPIVWRKSWGDDACE